MTELQKRQMKMFRKKTENKWHVVDLPKYFQEVLVKTKSGQVAVGYLTSTGWVIQTRNGIAEDVVKWTEIPEDDDV